MTSNERVTSNRSPGCNGALLINRERESSAQTVQLQLVRQAMLTRRPIDLEMVINLRRFRQP
jgi:hypothetical protein